MAGAKRTLRESLVIGAASGVLFLAIRWLVQLLQRKAFDAAAALPAALGVFAVMAALWKAGVFRRWSVRHAPRIRMLPEVLILLSFAVAAYLNASPALPDQLAVHWNVDGAADAFEPKVLALFLLPAAMLAAYLLLLLVPRIDPLRANIEQFRKPYDRFVALLIGFLFVVYVATLALNAGYFFNIGYLVILGLSAVIYYTGSLMRSTKRNYFIGVRTPWALASDIVWQKTHRVAAELFETYAILLLFSIVFLEYFLALLLVPLALILVSLFAYSYYEYRKLGRAVRAKPARRAAKRAAKKRRRKRRR
jgi:uncharacterized membrane protein